MLKPSQPVQPDSTHPELTDRLWYQINIFLKGFCSALTTKCFITERLSVQLKIRALGRCRVKDLKLQIRFGKSASIQNSASLGLPS